MLLRLLRGLIGLVDRASDVAAAIGMVMIVLMIATVLFEVTSRQVFGFSTIWAYDISRMLNGGLFMIGAAYTLRKGSHVRIDFLFETFSKATRHLLQLLFYVVLLVPVLGLATQYIVLRAHRAFVRGTLENASAWEPLLWPFLTVLAVGVSMLLLQVLAESLRSVLDLIDITRRRTQR